jgi:hypothetical protein
MDKPRPNEMFDPRKLDKRIETLKREGRLPTLEQFLAAVAEASEQLQEVIETNEQAVPVPAAVVPQVVSVEDYEGVRDHLLGFIGPGSLRAALAKASGRRRVIPIRGDQERPGEP